MSVAALRSVRRSHVTIDPLAAGLQFYFRQWQ
jgi:hypothetical protein